MNIKPKPFMIIVHFDQDGGVSAICIINHIKQKYGMDAEYKIIHCGYHNVDAIVERIMDNPEKYERVFIADISVNVELAKEFPDNFLLLDHHDSCKDLQGIKNCIVDTSGNHCGASLCYKHLLKDVGLEYKHLTKLVAIALDYDLYHLKLPNNIAKNLNFLYYFYWGERFIKRFLEGFDGYTDDEIEHLKKKWEEINSIIKSTTYIDLMEEEGKEYKNKYCMIVFPGINGEVNDLCEYALNKLNFEVVTCVLPHKNKLSTRISQSAADKGLHVGNLHVELGIGGGHPKAGGASYHDENHLELITQTLAEKIIELKI